MINRKWTSVSRRMAAPLRILTALLFAFSTLASPVSLTYAQDDLATQIAEVQAATTITGTLDNLVANFNLIIPDLVIAEGYRINSRITLSGPLPTGSQVTITRDGYTIVDGATFDGTQKWITDLMGLDLTISAVFDHAYDNHTETYVITVSGNTEPINVDITIESILSSDLFVSHFIVLADTTLTLVKDIEGLSEGLADVQAATSITGTLENLVADFNLDIPEVVVGAGFKINSLITLSEPLPEGSLVTITRDGGEYVTEATFTGTEQWITDLLGYPLSVSADFNHAYDDHTETYIISVTGNSAPINVDITIQSIISRDLFATEQVVLAETTLNLTQDILDEDLAIAYVQDHTSITGTLDDLVATFDLVIPEVIVSAGYRINSLITLSEPLPEGSLVTINRDGFSIVTNATFDGTQKWITDLMVGYELSDSAFFDHIYDNHSESYVISVSGNSEPIDVEITIQSIISKDLFTTNQVILAESTLHLVQDILDEDLAIAYVQANTTLSGSLAALTATFPTDIPDVISAETYRINSRMTLERALPEGSTVSIQISVNGGDPMPYVTDVLIPGTVFWVTDLFDPAAPAADFDGNYGGRVEIYNISIDIAGSSSEFDTNVKIESIISKDEFVTPILLADISLPIHVDDTTSPALLVSGVTADGNSLPGDMESGYILGTTGDPRKDRLVQFAAGTTATEDLANDYFEFFLTESTVSAAELEAYYTARGVPEPYLTYLVGAANGTNPFVMIKGSTVTLVDAAKHTIQSLDVDFTVPDDFPTGTYTTSGKIVDLYGNETPVTLTLIVERVPSFSVNPQDDTVHGWFWPVGAEVTLSAHDTEFIETVDENGEVDFLDLGLDLVAGDLLTLTSDSIVKNHIIKSLTFSGYDLGADTILGTAPADSLVHAWACDTTQCLYSTATANSSDVWQADFSGMIDVIPGSTGGAQIVDEDNDDTRINWRIPEAYIWVYPDADLNYIRGVGWNPGSQVFLSVDAEPYGMRVAGSDGAVQFTDLAVNLEAGMTVELTDGITTRTHTIIDLTVSGIDQETDQVSGTANYPGEVETFVFTGGDLYWAYADVDESRNWTASYAADISWNVYGGVRQFDEQGNSTRIYWEINNPYLIVDPRLDTVTGINWRKSSPIVISINSSAGAELYATSALSDENGVVELDLASVFDIQPEMRVILEDGFSRKGHDVLDLVISLVDEDSDVIAGTAAPGSLVSVAAFDSEQTGYGLDVTANTSGDWTVDFTGIIDIVVGTKGYAQQRDADQNITRVNYMVVNQVPVLQSLSPSFSTVGAQQTTLIVKGDNFSDGYSTVRWNGEDRPTTFISHAQLSIQLSPEDLDTVSTPNVAVFTSAPGGGLSAAAIDFPVIGYSPANGEQLALTMPFFSWDAIPGATKYRIELYADSALTKLVFSAKTSLLVYAYLTPLVDGKTYYWRIQPMYAGVWSGEWSPVMYFFSRNPPGAPMLLSPENKSATSDPLVELTWAPADRGDYYMLQVATDPYFAHKVLKETLPAGQLAKWLDFTDAALGQGKYYWRVRAYDALNVKGPWSMISKFKVDWTPPAAPILYKPPDNKIKDKVPTFRWFAAAGAKTYTFEYRLAGESAWIVAGPMAELYYKPPITESGTYEWRLRAFDKAGNQSESVIRTLTIAFP